MARAAYVALQKLVVLAEYETERRRPEADAEVIPLAPATSAHFAMWRRASFIRLRRTRLFLGLRSASQQHREGVWAYRPEWAFPSLSLAKRCMEGEYGTGHGFLVRVLELPAILFEADCAWLAMSGLGEGNPSTPEAAGLYQSLVGNFDLIKASAPLSAEDRAQISAFLRESALVAWAAPADCDWHAPGAVESPLLVHTLGAGRRWVKRSRDRLEP